MRKNQLLILVVVVSLILTLLPLLSSQWFFTHDFVHGARIAEFARGLMERQFPVVWSKNFGYGYGMPLFLFYAPLPYFMGSLLYLSGLDLIPSLKILYILVSLISATGVFLLVRKMFNTTSGLLSALIYIYTPYRALNLYVRGAVSESFGMAFSAFVLWGVMLAWQKKWYGPLVLAISLWAVALSHNLSLLLILPIAVAWSGYLFIEDLWLKKNHDLKSCLQSTKAVVWGVVLGLGLSAFYLIPAAAYQNLTKVQQIVLSGYADYRFHFLYIRQWFDSMWGYGGSNWGPNDDMSFFLGFAPLFGLGFFLGLVTSKIILALWHKKLPQLSQISRLSFFAIFAMVCLLFSTPKLQLVWDHVGLLRVLQFPWRFLGPVALLLAIVSGGLLNLINKTFWQNLILVTFIILSLLAVRFFQPAAYLEDNQGLYYSDPARIAHEMSGILPDYIPKQVPDHITAADQAIVSSTKNLDQFNVLSWNSKQLEFETKQTQTSTLTLAIANFPGWQATVNHQPVSIQTSPTGLIDLTLTGGFNIVTLSYKLTLLQKICLALSGISLVVLVIISYHAYRYQYESTKL